MISTGALIAAGLVSAIGAGGSAINRRKGKVAEQAGYERAKDYLNSLYHRDPLTTVGNQALLKTVRQNHADEIDAVQNRMAAGGGTMENALAARQASNEGLDKVYSQLLMGEDARRDRIAQQQLALDQQHSANLQSGFYQSAQDWQQWGAQTAGSILSYGSTGLLDGDYAKGLAARDAATASGINQDLSGLGFSKQVRVDRAANNGLLQTPDLGGLKGPGYDINRTAIAGRFPYTED